MSRAREAGWLVSLFVAAYWLLGGRQRAFEDGRRWGRIEGIGEAFARVERARAVRCRS